jgi:hypothetical protein
MNVADRVIKLERKIQEILTKLMNIRAIATTSGHHATHEAGGLDAIKLDDLASPDDNTDLNVATNKHGLTPKRDGAVGSALRGDGTWGAAIPATHQTSHNAGQPDALKLDDLAAPDANLDLNVGTHHGLCPALPADGTLYLDGIGGWTAPAGGGGAAAKIGLFQMNESFDGLATAPIAGQGAYTDMSAWAFDGDGGANETALVAVLGGADKALFIWQAIEAVTRNKKAYVDFTNEEGIPAGKWKFDWSCSDVDKSGDMGFQLVDAANVVCFHLYFAAATSKMTVYDGSSTTLLYPVTDGTVYSMMIIFEGLEVANGYAWIWINGVMQGRFKGRTGTVPTRIQFFVGNATHAAASTMMVNNLKVWNFWRSVV